MIISKPTAKHVRIRGIDIARSLAIVAAMISHAMVTFDVTRLTGQSFGGLRFVFQMAPPVFIGLFGAMLEIAYLRRFVSGDAKGATSQLLNRAVQCYLLYVISLVALVVAGKYSALFAIRSALLAGVTPFTDILKFYACALLLAPVLIWCRLRLGLASMLAFAIFVHIGYPIIKLIPEPEDLFGVKFFDFLIGFIYGGGGGRVGGPSLLHGLTFVTCGMVVGHSILCLFSPDRRERTAGIGRLSFILSMATVTVVCLWDWSDSARVVTKIANLSIRNDNHPLYFVLGLSASTVFVLGCVFVFDKLGQHWADSIRFMGTVSLFTFCFGNVLLYLVPFKATSGPWSLALTAIFSALIVLQSWLFNRLVNIDPASIAGSELQAAIAVQRIVRTSKRWIGTLVEKPARLYTQLLWSDCKNEHDNGSKVRDTTSLG